MIRVALLALSIPVAGLAQSSGDAAPPLPDTPRAIAIFSGVQGYDDLAPERVGHPAKPVEHELGLVLVSRIFRNTCLSLERGASLESATPTGFSPFDAGFYLMGTAPTGQTDRLVLSPTGDIDADETTGHPSIWLTAHDTGMTCRIEWNMENPPAEDRRIGMAQFIEKWLPFEYALVRVERPTLNLDPSVAGFAEWDRPCGDRWCPMSVIYDLPDGSVVLNTMLNITGIEGDRP